MLTVDEATQKLRGLLHKVDGTENIPIEEALGRTLAEAIPAPLDLPPFDSSAMDGYALGGDGKAKKNQSFKVVGESLAGHPSVRPLLEGEACRIFTGAAIPPDARSVVIQEDTRRAGDEITIKDPVETGDNVRIAGMDIAKGEQLAAEGDVLTPFAIGWLAACGISSVRVTRKIRVGVFSTGDELADPGLPLKPGQIYESNRMSLAMLMKSKAVELVDIGRLPDDYQLIKRSIEKITNEIDMLVTSGGVSVGDADFVRPVVEAIGNLEFWNIALKPGKPLAIGKVGRALFFGLPGNPVSTIVTYLLFVAPAIDGLSGSAWKAPTSFQAKLSGTIKHRAGRREYQRGIFTTDGATIVVAPTGDQSSNRLASFHHCNCLILVPAERDNIDDGESVEIHLLPRPDTFA